MTKTISTLIIAGIAWSPVTFAQTRAPAPVSAVRAENSTTVVADPNRGSERESHLTRFDLDFAGGTPNDLVRAIEKATGKPLNIVIPTGAADVPLPPLKMRGITVAELFKALQAASQS